MSTQPEALRLADALNRAAQQEAPDDDVICVARWFVKDSAAELRRLNALNTELLKALKENTTVFEVASNDGGINFYAYAQDNRAIIAKAEAQ